MNVGLVNDTIEEIADDLEKIHVDRLREKLKDVLIAKKCSKTIIDWVSNHTDLKKIINALKSGTIFQICFVVDVTKSTKRYKEIANTFIALLTQSALVAGIPNAKFYYAYVGYRERDEMNEFLQLTEDSESVINALRKSKRAGGGDDCEDVEYALKTVYNKIDWLHGGTRIIFHIADAPCHGGLYHAENLSDDHPDWSDKIPTYLNRLVNGLSIFYWFVKMTNDTDKMIKEFNIILNGLRRPNALDGMYCVNVIDLRNGKEETLKAILQCLQATWMSSVNAQ